MAIQRLKKRADFLRVARSGRKYVCPAFVLQIDQWSSPDLRFGVTASKKVGNAVKRNLAKRRMRVLFNASENLKDGYDYVLIARHAIFKREFAKMQEDLNLALKRILRVQNAEATKV